MSKIILVNPPISKNPNVEKSQRKSRIIAIILKMPGNKLIRKRIIIK